MRKKKNECELEPLINNIKCMDFHENICIYTSSDSSKISTFNLNKQLIKCTTFTQTNSKYVKLNFINALTCSTTGAEGLQLYDFEKHEIFKSYRKEKLYDHIYHDNIYVTYDDYNIKYYDIRMRYMTHNVKMKNIEKIEFLGNNVIVKTDDKIVEIEDKRVKKEYFMLEKDASNKNFDFAVSNDNLFVLHSNTLKLYSCGSCLEKNGQYNNMCGINFNRVNFDTDGNMSGIGRILQKHGHIQFELTNKIFEDKKITGKDVNNIYFNTDEDIYVCIDKKLLKATCDADEKL